jgi:hypothetical protein
VRMTRFWNNLHQVRSKSKNWILGCQICCLKIVFGKSFHVCVQFETYFFLFFRKWLNQPSFNILQSYKDKLWKYQFLSCHFHIFNRTDNLEYRKLCNQFHINFYIHIYNVIFYAVVLSKHLESWQKMSRYALT